jgi:hypothetical protein
MHNDTFCISNLAGSISKDLVKVGFGIIEHFFKCSMSGLKASVIKLVFGFL